MLCSEDDLREDGFTESFKFDSRPPQNASWRRLSRLDGLWEKMCYSRGEQGEEGATLSSEARLLGCAH